MRHGALCLQGGAGTGHRNVEGFIHGTPGLGSRDWGFVKAGCCDSGIERGRAGPRLTEYRLLRIPNPESPFPTFNEY
ncbi:hypothetical protein XOC_2383 [Xanthomonas oryzae pv. oryzicola BLS256]|uniref:Uncharacterized protein n=1 Tax=Xanthomonas oryzae pv. oryzicola (strain BLS256) TaxID=383407 RepID=G7TFF8_XANOB|nr:hypothetical protein XOC_2383 [Xanthomonas oryzae pv. oryzicola BLS256]